MAPEDWGRGDTKRRPTRDFPVGVLELVDRKQGGRFCALCRQQQIETPASEPLVIDHLQPLTDGGTNHWTNLRWLCRSHNAGRRDRAGWRGLPAWLRRQRRPS